jgi:hypothetical protein
MSSAQDGEHAHLVGALQAPVPTGSTLAAPEERTIAVDERPPTGDRPQPEGIRRLGSLARADQRADW